MVVLILGGVNLSQGQTCGTEAAVMNRSENFSNLKFFQDDSCIPLVVKCNFIVLNRTDGTGGMDDAFINSLKNNTNQQWGQIIDNQNCENGEDQPLDTKIRLDFKVFKINNTDLWDYNAQAQIVGNSSYFDNYFSPSELDSRWPALDNLIQQYRAQYPDRINIVFIDNGARLDFYDQAIANGVNIPSKWDIFDPEPAFSEIYSGYSFWPDSDYFASDRREFILIADLYSKYIGQLNFGHIENPNSGKTNEELAGIWQWAAGVLLMHELGHSFNLGHTCGCIKNVMSS